MKVNFRSKLGIVYIEEQFFFQIDLFPTVVNLFRPEHY